MNLLNLYKKKLTLEYTNQLFFYKKKSSFWLPLVVGNFKSGIKINLNFKSLFLFQWIQFGPKSFSCTICNNYTTNRRNNVIRHIKVHTDDKQFTCEECSYAAITKQNLTNHIEKRHSGTFKYL